MFKTKKMIMSCLVISAMLISMTQNVFAEDEVSNSEVSNNAEETTGTTETVKEYQIPVSLEITEAEYVQNTPEFSVTIPSSINFNETGAISLDMGKDMYANYQITVDKLANASKVIVSYETDGYLESTDENGATTKLPYTNKFGPTEYTENGGMGFGTLTVAEKDLEKAKNGNYTGTVDFVFTGVN